MTDLLKLYEIADNEGIEVDCFEMRKREAFSLMDTDGVCFIAIDPFRLTSERDELSKLAHELGHCMTGSFYDIHATCDVRQRHENRADRWAVERVIPADALTAAVEAGHTDLWSLADHFGVTEDFVKKAVCLHTHGNLAAELYF